MKIEDIYGFRDIQLNVEALQHLIVRYQDRIDLLDRLDSEEAREIVADYERYIKTWFEQIKQSRELEKEIMAFVDGMEEEEWRNYIKFRYILGNKPKDCCGIFNMTYEGLKAWDKGIKEKYKPILVYKEMVDKFNREHRVNPEMELKEILN